MPPTKNQPDSPERLEYARFLKILGQRIRSLRKQRGWSYRTMVAEHGFHLSAWQSYESGKYGLSMISLLRVAKVFGMPAAELIADIDLSTPEPMPIVTPTEVPAEVASKPARRRVALGGANIAAKGV